MNSMNGLTNIDDNYILNKFIGKDGRIKSILFRNLSDEELDYINKRFSDSLSIKETVYRIKNNVSTHPKCIICGDYVQFVGNLFKQVCSRSDCKNKFKHIRYQEACFNKYGVSNVFGSDKIKNKIRITFNKKFGGNCPFASEEIRNKYKNTCLDRFGVDNNLKLTNIQSKIHSPEATNKMKQTKFEKYGSTGNKNEIREALLEKYGVNSVSKLPWVIEKIIETKRKNHTLNSSKQEDKIF